MARRFSLESEIGATVDQQSAERAGQELSQTLEDEVGDLQVGADTGGVGGLGGARGGGGGGGGMGAPMPMPMGKGAMGAAASAAMPVAIAGAVGFGLLQGIQSLASASPALKQTTSILGAAWSYTLRPLGDALSEYIRPFAEEALNMAINFNEIYSSDGLSVAVGVMASKVIDSLAGAVGSAFGDILGGEGTLGDWLVAGTTAVAATKLIKGSATASKLITGTASASNLIGGSVPAYAGGATGGLVVGTIVASALVSKVAADTLFHTTDLETLLETGASGPGTQGDTDATDDLSDIDTTSEAFENLPDFAKETVRQQQGVQMSDKKLRDAAQDQRQRNVRGAAGLAQGVRETVDDLQSGQTQDDVVTELQKLRDQLSSDLRNVGNLSESDQSAFENLDPY